MKYKRIILALMLIALIATAFLAYNPFGTSAAALTPTR